MKVWLITNIPSPYQVELLQNVSTRQADEVTIRFMRHISADDPQVIGNADVGYISSFGLFPNRDELTFHPQALRECWRGNWSAFVLSGTIASPTLLLCCFALYLRRKPWILWLERPHPKSVHAPWGPKLVYRGPARWARNIVIKWLLRNCSSLIAIGSQAKQEYINLGVKTSKVHSLSYCCNTGRFNCTLSEGRVLQCLENVGLGDRTILLFSGQLIERKGIPQLLKMFERIATKRPNVALFVLGDGPLRRDVESFCIRTKLLVVAPGHVPQSDLPAWFGRADVFLFPSRHDGWGVVVNEACAAGLPCIVSSQTGSACDLVKPGENGWVIDWADEDQWVEAALRLIDSPRLREEMGIVSRKIAEANSAEIRATDLWKCVETTIASHQ